MGILFKKVSERVFELLKGQSYQVSLYDEYGNRVYDAEEARMFFANPVKMMLNIVDDNDNSTIRVNVSKQQKIEEIKELLNQLRLAATHFGLMFTVRQYAKDLKPKDFAFLATKPVEESTSLSKLAKYVAQETITEETATWASLFSKLDNLMEHPRSKDSEYLGQAERWTSNQVTESDVILNRIISTINEQLESSRQAKWFTGDTRIKLEGIMAMAKKKLTESGDGNWDAYNRYDDQQVSAEQEWEDYLHGFDAEDFAQYVLNDLIGYDKASQIPADELPEIQEILNAELATEEDVASYLSLYISRETEGRIEDAGSELVDQSYQGFAKCGFTIPPMEVSPNSEINAFESWVNSFDPESIIKTQQIKEATKAKKTKQKISEMRGKIAIAKSNKSLMEKKVFQDQKNRLFDIAHKMSAHRNEPNDLKALAKGLTESEINNVLDVIADVWEPAVAADIKQTMEEVIDIRNLTRERIAEARRTDRTLDLGDDFRTDDLRKLAGLKPLNESWSTPTASVMMPPMEQANAGESLHKQRLLADIKRLVLQLGMEEDGAQITDEGGALLYVTWNSTDSRAAAETALSSMGHQVNNDYWIGSNTSEIPVDVYHGYDAQVNPVEFSEAVASNSVGVSVFMEQPYKRDLVDTVHDTADELGFQVEPYYPEMANGLILKCANEYQANELIQANKHAGINLYIGTNEAKSDFNFSDEDMLLDKDFDGEEGDDFHDEEEELDEASLLGTHMTPDAKARDTEESDAEYIHQMQFKRKWKSANPGKAWPGYSAAGYKHPKYNLDEVRTHHSTHREIAGKKVQIFKDPDGSGGAKYTARILPRTEVPGSWTDMNTLVKDLTKKLKSETIKEADGSYEKGYYLYSTIGADQASPVLSAYGSFGNLFDANKRISEMDAMEEDGVAVCYYDGENFRPTKGNKILRRDLAGDKLEPLNKASVTEADRDPSTTGKSGTEWAPWLAIMHSELEDGGPATLAMIERVAWYSLSSYSHKRMWTVTACKSLEAAVDDLVHTYLEIEGGFGHKGKPESSARYQTNEQEVTEDWGSSDWSALINTMDKEINGKYNPDTITAAAESAAEFYGEHLGYNRHEDAVDSIIAMYMRRKFKIGAN